MASFWVFRHCAIFWKNTFFRKKISKFFSAKNNFSKCFQLLFFEYFWALDMAPTWDDPVLSLIRWIFYSWCTLVTSPCFQANQAFWVLSLIFSRLSSPFPISPVLFLVQSVVDLRLRFFDFSRHLPSFLFSSTFCSVVFISCCGFSLPAFIDSIHSIISSLCSIWFAIDGWPILSLLKDSRQKGRIGSSGTGARSFVCHSHTSFRYRYLLSSFGQAGDCILALVRYSSFHLLEIVLQFCALDTLSDQNCRISLLAEVLRFNLQIVFF